MSFRRPLPSTPPDPLRKSFWEMAKAYFDARQFRLEVSGEGAFPTLRLRIFLLVPEEGPSAYRFEKTVAITGDESLLKFFVRLVRTKMD